MLSSYCYPPTCFQRERESERRVGRRPFTSNQTATAVIQQIPSQQTNRRSGVRSSCLSFPPPAFSYNNNNPFSPLHIHTHILLQASSSLTLHLPLSFHLLHLLLLLLHTCPSLPPPLLFSSHSLTFSHTHPVSSLHICPTSLPSLSSSSVFHTCSSASSTPVQNRRVQQSYGVFTLNRFKRPKIGR